MSRGEMTLAEKKELAKLFFVVQKLSQKEAAEKARVTEKTMSKWVNENKWRELQQSMLLTREQQMTQMLNELKIINDEISAGDAKRANKEQAYVRDTLVQNIKKLQLDTGAEAFIDCADRLCQYVRRFDPEKALEINNYFDSLIREEVLK